jgi:hypothetical protein
METWVYQHISDFLWRLSAHFTLALRAAARLARPLDRPSILSWIWWLWGYKWWIQVSSCLLFLAVTVGSYWRWEAKTEYCLFFFFSAWIKPFFSDSEWPSIPWRLKICSVFRFFFTENIVLEFWGVCTLCRRSDQRYFYFKFSNNWKYL